MRHPDPGLFSADPDQQATAALKAASRSGKAILLFDRRTGKMLMYGPRIEGLERAQQTWAHLGYDTEIVRGSPPFYGATRAECKLYWNRKKK